MGRITYEHKYNIIYGYDAAGNISKQFVYRFSRNGRFAIGYQIQNPNTGRLQDIVRYDNARGYFHRHPPGFPPGDDHIPTDFDEKRETVAKYVRRDLAAHAAEYERDAIQLGYPELEDDYDENNDESEANEDD